jgi:hypothetical protein
MYSVTTIQEHVVIARSMCQSQLKFVGQAYYSRRHPTSHCTRPRTAWGNVGFFATWCAWDRVLDKRGRRVSSGVSPLIRTYTVRIAACYSVQVMIHSSLGQRLFAGRTLFANCNSVSQMGHRSARAIIAPVERERGSRQP